MPEIVINEVYFNVYCPKCKHKDLPEEKEPCYECLMHPMNDYSHKPVRYEEE